MSEAKRAGDGVILEKSRESRSAVSWEMARAIESSLLRLADGTYRSVGLTLRPASAVSSGWLHCPQGVGTCKRGR